MANDTLGQTHFCIPWVSVKDRSLKIATLAAEKHLGVLREDLRALGDDSTELNQSVKMDLAQFSDLVLDWQLCDPHKDLLMEVGVVRVDFLHNLASNRVKNW